MHVALVDPSEFSPPYDAALAAGLLAAGHRVTIIGSAGGGLGHVAGLEHFGHFYRPLATAVGRRLPTSAVRAAKGLLHVADMARLPALLRRLGVDVIHFQWTPLPLVDQAVLQGLRRVAPVVLTVHDTVPYNGAEPWLMAAGMRRLIQGVDAVITHTEQGGSRLLRQGVPQARLHVVPHGLLGARTDAPPPPAGGRIQLLQFGKIKPYKGVDVLLRALAELPPAERERFRIRVVGRPYLDTRVLEALAQDLALADIVRFDFGFVPDTALPDLFAAADALVFPYRDIEASGVLMQAVASGLPVLASRIGAFAEILEDRRQALLVSPNDPTALAAALSSLAKSPEQLVAMRSEMRALRDRVPSWEAIGRQTIAIYAAAAAHRAPLSARSSSIRRMPS